MRKLHIKHPQFVSLAEEILSSGCSFRFVARGRSMRPFLRHNDVLTISPVKNGSLRKRDILLYRTDAGGVFVHRYLGMKRKKDDDILVLRGDACLAGPDYVHKNQVIGTVVEMRRGERRIPMDNFFYRFLVFCWTGSAPFISSLMSMPSRVCRLLRVNGE